MRMEVLWHCPQAQTDDGLPAILRAPGNPVATEDSVLSVCYRNEGLMTTRASNRDYGAATDAFVCLPAQQSFDHWWRNLRRS
jgi:hypothetical protein